MWGALRTPELFSFCTRLHSELREGGYHLLDLELPVCPGLEGKGRQAVSPPRPQLTPPLLGPALGFLRAPPPPNFLPSPLPPSPGHSESQVRTVCPLDGFSPVPAPLLCPCPCQLASYFCFSGKLR